MDTVQPWALRLHVERASCCCLHTCDMNVQIQCNVTHVTRMMLWGSFYKCGAVRVSMGVHHGPYSARTNPAAVPRPLLEQTGVPASSLEAIAVACSATPSHCTCRRFMAELPEAPSSKQHPLLEAPSSKQHPLLEAPSSKQHPLPEAPSSKQHPLLLVPCPKLGPHHHLLNHNKVGHTLDWQVGAPSNPTLTPPTPTPRACVRPARKEAHEAIPWRCIMGHGTWPMGHGDASLQEAATLGFLPPHPMILDSSSWKRTRP